MKAPLNWLKDFVDITLSAEELAHVITMAGLEVAEIRYIGVEGAELPWERDKILVANVLEVRSHPNADMLVLAEVEYGAGQPHTVVTGAPNLFPYKDQGPLTHPLRAVFAREGARLYDGHKEGWEITTLKGRPVRGVMSDAMLCSEKELGISEEHEGILFLEDDAPIGMPLCDLLGDVVLDIDITPNLARCLSMVGIAREVAALTGAQLHIPDPQVQMDGAPVEGRVKVTVEETRLCPRFTAGLIEGITIGPSPAWMQRRLTYAGMRPINNIVDISNYVMLEWGEPTHAFDADCVHDQHLVVRLAQPDEQLTTLDGKQHNLHPDGSNPNPPLLVCDPTGALALAGVMGGESSEVSDTTTRILLEAAIWEPGQIRRTAQAFKIPSEASRRFERGVDIEVGVVAQRRALELMRTLAGGVVAQGLVDVYAHPWETPVLDLPPAEVQRIVGVRLTAYDIAEMLRSLGFSCEVHGDEVMGDLVGYAIWMGLDASFVRVSVPSFRQDVSCLAELCEEIARVYGYEKVPSTLLRDEIPRGDAHPEVELTDRVRDIMTGCQLHDVITYSLTSMEAVAKLNPSEAVASRYLRLTNAVSPEREYLQRSLLPTLLEALVNNLYERERAGLFEIGHVFLPTTGEHPAGSEEWLPAEPRHLAIALAGSRVPLNWSLAQGNNGQAVLDFFDIKGVIETLLEQLGLRERVSFAPLTDDERFHPGRAATLLLHTPVEPAAEETGKKKKKKKGKVEYHSEAVGVLGEVHPDACERFEFQVSRVTAAEVNLDKLFALVQPPSYAPVSRYPATVQDLAIVVGSEVPAERVASLIALGAGDLLEAQTLFDVYSGPQIGEGKRSLAYRLVFRAPDRTLSDDALVKVRKKIASLLEREVGATLRA